MTNSGNVLEHPRTSEEITNSVGPAGGAAPDGAYDAVPPAIPPEHTDVARERSARRWHGRLVALGLTAVVLAGCTGTTPTPAPTGVPNSPNHVASTSETPTGACPLPDVLPAPPSWHVPAEKPGAHAGEPLASVGFSTYPVRLDGTPGPAERLQRRYKQLVDAHVTQVRFDAAWNRIEPQPCQYDWSLLDPWMQGLAQRNIGALMIAGKVPQWATDVANCNDEGKCEPRDPNDYAQFVRALATRYSLYAPDIELGNEIKNIPATVYERMCGLAYADIKQASPRSLVVFGSKAATDPQVPTDPDRPATYFRAVMAARNNAGETSCKYDVMSAHPYTGHFLPGENDAANGWGQMLELLAAMRSMPDYHDQPVWATEFGTPVLQSDDESTQAKQFTAAIEQIRRQSGITQLFWFTLKTEIGLQDLGAINTHDTPRPVFRLIQGYNHH